MAALFFVLFNLLLYVLSITASLKQQKSVKIFIVLFVIQILLVLLMIVLVSKKNPASDFISLGFTLLAFLGLHAIVIITLIIVFIKRLRS